MLGSSFSGFDPSETSGLIAPVCDRGRGLLDESGHRGRPRYVDGLARTIVWCQADAAAWLFEFAFGQKLN
jgi:hypothetical protein